MQYTGPQVNVKGATVDRKLLEYHFVFACVWAFGGTMLVDKVYDYRAQFSKWWVGEWKIVQFPDKVGGPRPIPLKTLKPACPCRQS